jgi:hypothetical protein
MIQLTKEKAIEICNAAVRRFGRQEWFRDVIVHPSYPTNGEPTLEIKVNYIPVFERAGVMDFAQSYGLHEKFTTVDRNGNPVE